MTLSPELEEAFGARVDKAVDKVGGLLPVEWSMELRSMMRTLVLDAYDTGASQAWSVDADARRSF